MAYLELFHKLPSQKLFRPAAISAVIYVLKGSKRASADSRDVLIFPRLDLYSLKALAVFSLVNCPSAGEFSTSNSAALRHLDHSRDLSGRCNLPLKLLVSLIKPIEVSFKAYVVTWCCAFTFTCIHIPYTLLYTAKPSTMF